MSESSSKTRVALTSGNVFVKSFSSVSDKAGSVATSRKTLKKAFNTVLLEVFIFSSTVQLLSYVPHFIVTILIMYRSHEDSKHYPLVVKAYSYLCEYFDRMVVKFLLAPPTIVALSCDAKTINSSNL